MLIGLIYLAHFNNCSVLRGSKITLEIVKSSFTCVNAHRTSELYSVSDGNERITVCPFLFPDCVKKTDDKRNDLDQSATWPQKFE